MPRRHPLPRLWLMTDERQGEGLWAALAALPKGSGVVFRHYHLPPRERRALFERVRGVARRRRLLLLAGGDALPRADGRHGRGRGRLSAPVHSIPELKAAERSGAKLVFVSPVFPTRSHPEARGLGRHGLGRLARAARVPVIALGGMDARRARGLAGLNVYGWAGIDAWTS